VSLFGQLKRRNVFRVGAAYIVTAWLIVQVVETLFPIYGLSEAAMRMVVNVLAIGLVPALVLAWVFEWTPEGLKRDEQTDHSHPALLKSAKRLDRIILAVLALALGYFAFDRFVLVPRQMEQEAAQAREEGRGEALAETYGDRSIAVLAFDDMSPAKDQEYLSDGIAEEVLNLLAQIPALRVISRSSAFSFKGRDVPVTEIARQLNVSHVLEGSVRKAGDRIRVTAQLIDARSDTHIWSKTFDRTLDDIFAIQDELAASMVDQLQLKLLGDTPHARRVDPEAYLLYLEGHRLVAFVDSERAASLLEQAVTIDPGFADAWADLGRSYYQMSDTSFDVDHEGDVNYFKSREAMDRVAELDPDHPWVSINRVWELVENDGNYAAAAGLTEQAIERYPNNWDVQRLTLLYSTWIRRDDVAMAVAGYALARNPLCTDCSYLYARTALIAGHYREAMEAIKRYRNITPGAGYAGRMTLGTAKLLAGDFDGAREAFRHDEAAPDTNPEETEARELYGELLVRIATGDKNGLQERIQHLAGLDSSLKPVGLAELYAMAGDFDESFTWLDQLAASSNVRVIAHETRSPLFAVLHDDPRWLKLLEGAGVAPRQLAQIEFNPKLPD